MAFRNKELVDRGFTNIKSQVKTLDYTVARGGVNIDDFRKEVKKLYDKVEDFMKSMDSEPSKANDSMWTQTSTADTSTADTSTDTVEPEVEKEKPNWRNYRENATGEGASMTGGPGMGHFGKKKK